MVFFWLYVFFTLEKLFLLNLFVCAVSCCLMMSDQSPFSKSTTVKLFLISVIGLAFLPDPRMIERVFT